MGTVFHVDKAHKLGDGLKIEGGIK